MGVVVGFFAGLIAAFLLFASALGGVFIRVLAGEDDFGPDGDPADVTVALA